MTDSSSSYVCRYCRLTSQSVGGACPHCGAPTDVRALVSDSGWQKQPAIADMARIQFGESLCQIEGTYVPTADFNLRGSESIFFSHHSLLWADPTVDLQALPMQGGWNRVRAGLPLVMMQAGPSGHIALSDDAPGEIVAIPLQPGGAAWVREHRFLAATSSVEYVWEQPGVWFTTGSGDDTEWHYPLGQYIDIFHTPTSPGLLLLHSPGNTFIRDLAAGETICIQPGSLLYKDPGVGMQLHLEYPNQAGVTWGYSRNYSYRQVWLRMWGPGRVAVQSVFEREEESSAITNHSPATATRW